MSAERDEKEGKTMANANDLQPERPEWAHEDMRFDGEGWICDGCDRESCDCNEHF